MGSTANKSSSKSPDSRPVRLVVGSMKMYLVFGAENVAALFRNSKHLARDNLTRQAFHNSNAKIRADVNAAFKDKTAAKNRASEKDGDACKKIAEIDDEEAARISRKLHDMQHLILSQPFEIRNNTAEFSDSFQKELLKTLVSNSGNVSAADDETGISSYTTPLFKLLKQTMFVASTTALMGFRILKENPDLVDNYWAYDEAFLLGLPELMYPAGNSARDKLLKAVKSYVEGARGRLDIGKDGDVYWNSDVGCKLFRESLREMIDRGIAVEDQAGALLSLVWATASNSIPLTTWMIATLLEDQDLLNEVHKELAPAVTNHDALFDSADPNNVVIIDDRSLGSMPLLNSIYHECLRFRTSVTVTRRLTTDIEIGGCSLRKGNFVMAPSYLAHMDASVWKSHGGHGPHNFWPKRFCGTSQTEDDDQISFNPEVALKPESFLPYGGGNAICPGRFFSKLQILTAVATIVLMLDLEVKNYIEADNGAETDRPPKPDQRYAGGGVMPPDGDWAVKFTPRGKLTI